MARVTTLPEIWWPLMRSPSVITPWCCVCGRTGHLEQHHIVKRSAGQLVMHGHVMPKPVVTLCGHGNVDGCHGLAHQGRLHFRWVDADAGQEGWYLTHGEGGHLEYLLLDEPAKYEEALEMDGWVPVRSWGGDL